MTSYPNTPNFSSNATQEKLPPNHNANMYPNQNVNMYPNQNPNMYPNPNITVPPNQPQTTYIQVINNPSRRSTRWGNRRNFNSACFLFVYGGMDMAQGLGWNTDAGTTGPIPFQYSWFIGVIIGAVLASLSLTHLPKWIFYCLGGLLQLIDAIIFVSAPTQYTAIVAARYLGGVGIGIITVSFIIHNSEAVSSKYRGVLAALEQYGLALGIAMQVIMTAEWSSYSDFQMNTAHGIFGIVFSLFGTAFIYFSVESPIFYLRKNNEEMARSCQWHHMPTTTSNNACHEALEEAKRYVAEASSLSFVEELAASAMPFVKMIFCRCLVAFTFSGPLSLAMSLNNIAVYDYDDWSTIVWGVLRLIGTIVTILLVDTVGRKFVSVLGLLCMGALMLAMAGLFYSIYSLDNLYQIGRISMAFQFFAGLYAACTTTYLGEAFPMRIKPFLIALIICLEQMIHVIVIVTFPSGNYALFTYFLVVGIILVISMIIFVVLMPETRGLTLRQAGHRFRRVHDVKAY
ncbi:uncharacterized protein LOC117576846 [Drosophila albomicans]|uniref:Uncharacterized protein LOC117576846 n=1 Tax=Drosophila albomicans TaxID=7291 RepID=A0A6P8XWP3_DROAB|nr:uncharacterized protein LOC117576846 [Drosophila albomicans]